MKENIKFNEWRTSPLTKTGFGREIEMFVMYFGVQF